MDELVTLWGTLSEHWAAIVGAVFALLVAARSLLQAVYTGLRALDLALDGHYDWTWLGELSDAIEWLDKLLARAPAKSIWSLFDARKA